MIMETFSLKNMMNFQPYLMGRSTMMVTKLWNLTRVTVREATENDKRVDKEILEKELSNLW